MVADAFLDDIFLDRAGGEGLSSQITRALRRLVVSGSLPPGQRLTSTRVCAERLRVSRNVVIEAYETLISEGLFETRRGAGTFVADRSSFLPANDAPLNSFHVQLPDSGHFKHCAQPNTRLDFVPGVPALDEFPFDTWSRAMGAALRSPKLGYLSDTDPLGLRDLREAIAAHVGPSRGIACDPGQVIVLTGARQGFEMIIRLITGIGDAVLVEDPGYVEGRAVAIGLGRRVLGCPVGQFGADISEGFQGAKLFILTPAHQYPTGGRLAGQNARALLDQARSEGCLLIEDDYDGEFHHDKRAIPALSGVDDLRNTVHVGTFSKSMFPGLRLAYLIVPRPLVEPIAKLRGIIDGQPSTPLQAGLAAFINSGAFARHLRRMRRLYANRKNSLERTILRHARGVLTPLTSDSGLHLCCYLPEGVNDTALVNQLNAGGIGATALSTYALNPSKARPGLVIGFGNTAEQLYEGLITKICEAAKLAPQNYKEWTSSGSQARVSSSYQRQ